MTRVALLLSLFRDATLSLQHPGYDLAVEISITEGYLSRLGTSGIELHIVVQSEPYRPVYLVSQSSHLSIGIAGPRLSGSRFHVARKPFG